MSSRNGCPSSGFDVLNDINNVVAAGVYVYFSGKLAVKAYNRVLGRNATQVEDVEADAALPTRRAAVTARLPTATPGGVNDDDAAAAAVALGSAVPVDRTRWEEEQDIADQAVEEVVQEADEDEEQENVDDSAPADSEME